MRNRIVLHCELAFGQSDRLVVANGSFSPFLRLFCDGNEWKGSSNALNTLTIVATMMCLASDSS